MPIRVLSALRIGPAPVARPIGHQSHPWRVACQSPVRGRALYDPTLQGAFRNGNFSSHMQMTAATSIALLAQDLHGDPLQFVGFALPGFQAQKLTQGTPTALTMPTTPAAPFKLQLPDTGAQGALRAIVQLMTALATTAEPRRLGCAMGVANAQKLIQQMQQKAEQLGHAMLGKKLAHFDDQLIQAQLLF